MLGTAAPVTDNVLLVVSEVSVLLIPETNPSTHGLHPDFLSRLIKREELGRRGHWLSCQFSETPAPDLNC